MRKPITSTFSEHGFSLLEVILAAFLGTLLITGLLEVYFSFKTVYPLQDALARMQENGRFATHFFNQAIREAGYAGCQDASRPVHMHDALIGYSGNNLPVELRNQAVNGTDVIAIKQCRLTKSSNQFIKTTFFIANTGRRNQQNNPIYSLYEKIGDQPRSELVSGIENIHIRYGIAATTPIRVDKYLAANQLTATDWSKVRSVTIILLLNSIDAVLQQPQTYLFDDVTKTAKDRLLRRQWQMYIALRENE